MLEAALTAQTLLRPSDAIADGERLLRIFAKRGERDRLAVTYQRLAVALVGMGRSSQALEYCAAARSLFAELGNPVGRGAIANIVGMIDVQLGRAASALAQFDLAYETFTHLGDARGRTAARCNRSYACYCTGDFAAGARAARHALELANGNEPLRSFAFGNLASNRLGLGEIEGALADFDASFALARIEDRSNRLSDLAHYCRALFEAGRDDDAARIAGEIDAIRSGASRPRPDDHAALHALALAAGARGSAGARERALHEMRDALRRYFAELDGDADAAALAEFTDTANALRALREAGLDALEPAPR